MTELTLAGLSSSTLAVITLPGIAVTNAHCWATYFSDAHCPGSVLNIIIFNSGSRKAAVGLKECGVADKPLWVQIPHLTLGKLCSVFLLETKGAKCSYLKGGSDKLHTVYVSSCPAPGSSVVTSASVLFSCSTQGCTVARAARFFRSPSTSLCAVHACDSWSCPPRCSVPDWRRGSAVRWAK